MKPLESLTLATLREAELGFLGFRIKTRKQTPENWGAPEKEELADKLDFLERRFLAQERDFKRETWLKVEKFG